MVVWLDKTAEKIRGWYTQQGLKQSCTDDYYGIYDQQVPLTVSWLQE